MRKISEVTTQEEILEEVQKARVSLNEAAPEMRQLVEAEKEFTNYRGGIIALGLLLMFVGLVMAQLIFLAIILPYMLLVGLAGFAICIYGIVYLCTAPKKKVTKIVNQCNEIKDRIKAVYAKTDSCIPTKYFFTEGLDYIETLSNTGRVNTLSEALDKTDTQMNQWVLEGKYYDIVNQLYDITAIVNKEMWRW